MRLRGKQLDAINAAIKCGGDVHAAIQKTCEAVSSPQVQASSENLTRLVNTALRLETLLAERGHLADATDLETNQIGFLLNGIIWTAYQLLEPDAFSLFLQGSAISQADAEACIAVVGITVAP